MTLSIIIVNWNVKPLLEACVDSISKYAKGLNYEVIIVDNASKDTSQEYLRHLRKTSKRFKIILNKENLGFAKANNQAIKIAQGHFILFLNPDTEIYAGTLQKMLKYFSTHPNCGILGCRLIGVDKRIQPSVRSFPSLASQIMIFLKLHHLFPRVKCLKKYFLYDFDYNEEQKVDQVMGAFFAIRREVLEKIGFFDENFYLWFEEVDFCRRAKEADWDVVYVPFIKIFHQGAQSFHQALSLYKQKIYDASAIYYFRKYFPPKYSKILLFLRPISLFLAYLTQVFKIKRNSHIFHSLDKFKIVPNRMEKTDKNF